MRIFRIFIIFLFVSCTLTDAIDKKFQTETESTPFAKPQTTAEAFGDGNLTKIRIKFPLSESTIDRFDLEDILNPEGDTNRNSRAKTAMEKIKAELKLAAFNTALSFGFSNNIRISKAVSFPSIDPKYFKSLKVKKVFFTTEDCRKSDEDCNAKKGKRSSFNLLDKLMIKLSAFKPEIDGDLMNETSVVKLTGDVFKEERRKNLENFDSDVLESEKGEFKVLKFKNQLPNLEFRERKGYLTLKAPTKAEISDIREYLSSEDFKGIVKRVFLKARRGRSGLSRLTNELTISLVDGVKPQTLYDAINKKISPGLTKMLIVRLSSRFVETKKYFSQDKYKHLIEGMTLINKSLFIELKGNYQTEFKELLRKDRKEIQRSLDIYKFDRCDISNCLSLQGEDINLVPLAGETPNVKIDAYLGVRSLGTIDFKYNGYIEVEAILDLPL